MPTYHEANTDRVDDIQVFHMLQCYHALKIEVNTGLRHSHGSVMNLVKQMYLPDCTKRTKKGVLADFDAYLRDLGVLRD